MQYSLVRISHSTIFFKIPKIVLSEDPLYMVKKLHWNSWNLYKSMIIQTLDVFWLKFQRLKNDSYPKKKYFQACTGDLHFSKTKEQSRIFFFFYLSCILITIGLMIAIKKKRHIENEINHHGPKNLDNFVLNSVLFSVAIYSVVFVSYLKG